MLAGIARREFIGVALGTGLIGNQAGRTGPIAVQVEAEAVAWTLVRIMIRHEGMELLEDGWKRYIILGIFGGY